MKKIILPLITLLTFSCSSIKFSKDYLTSLPKTETLTISESDAKLVGKAFFEGTVSSKTFVVTVATNTLAAKSSIFADMGFIT